ncbi:MAG: purine-nucleoside phosphorylase [Coriobacteriales bacterium]|nr:purine-nucleoside phosphorylase [Coriobacteriales bacterium]
MPTPHNSAAKGQIAKTVLMPGDPLRAKVVAETFLDNPVCFNEVRGMLGFTGTYKGHTLSVMGSGMGIPSIAIYSYELYHFYDVDTIIRIGSAGGLAPQVNLRDIVIGQAACTDSNFAAQYKLPGTIAPIADFALVRRAVEVAESLGANYHVGNLLSSDVFYSERETSEAWAKMGVLGVEMEAAALYLNAIAAGKRALGIMTVSDLVLREGSLPAEERQNSFTQMMEIALETAISV